MNKRRGRRRPVSRSEVRGFLGKAEEWLETAAEALAHDRFTAATGTAIHAAINAGDAICGARLGECSNADAHREAVGLLQSVPNDGPAAANHLSRILSKKNRAEYDPEPITSAEAQATVVQAERLVAIARRVVAASLPPSAHQA